MDVVRERSQRSKVPRFEVHDEGVQSFWEITLAGKTSTLRWGGVGSRGQSRARHFASSDEARRDYDKQIALSLLEAAPSVVISTMKLTRMKVPASRVHFGS